MFQLLLEVFVNTGKIVQDVAVGVAEDTQALAFKEGRSFGIVLLFCVTVAVDFDDQIESGAVEIDDVGANGFLPEEFVAEKLPVAQDFLPDQIFGRRWLLAVCAGESSQALFVGEKFVLWGGGLKPLPSPPLFRGGSGG
nr:hypothetical protein [Quatrionicoccus australiensis]